MAVSKKSLEGHEGADAFGEVSASDYTYIYYDYEFGPQREIKGYLLSYSISEPHRVEFVGWEAPSQAYTVGIGNSLFVASEDYETGTFYGVFRYVEYTVKAAAVAELFENTGDREHLNNCRVYIDGTHELLDYSSDTIFKKGYRLGDEFTVSVTLDPYFELPDGTTERVGDHYAVEKWEYGGTVVAGSQGQASLTRTIGPGTAGKDLADGGRWVPYLKGSEHTVSVVVKPDVAADEGCTVTPMQKTYYYGTNANIGDFTATAATGWYFMKFFEDEALLVPVTNTSLYVTGDKTIYAVFTKKTVRVTLQTSPSSTGSGVFTINGEPVNYMDVPYGSKCVIGASAAAGSVFVRWEYRDGDGKYQDASTDSPFEFEVPNDRYNYRYQMMAADYPSYAETYKERYVDFWGVFDKGSGTGELLYGEDGGIVYGATGFPIYSGDKSPIILQTQAKGN